MSGRRDDPVGTTAAPSTRFRRTFLGEVDSPGGNAHGQGAVAGDEQSQAAASAQASQFPRQGEAVRILVMAQNDPGATGENRRSR